MSALREVFRFEVVTQLRQRSTAIYVAAFVGLAFLAMTTFVTGARGTTFNTPLAIAGATLIVSMLGLMLTASLAGDVATRDARTGMEPLLHTTPMGTGAYLGGRFLAAFAVNALLLTAVPIGLVLAAMSRGLAPDAAGPYRPAAYLGAYFLLALPNAFACTAVLFSLATLKRTAIASYGGALLLFLLSMASEGVLAEALGRWELARLVDPFGFVAVRGIVRTWSPAQKDTLLVGLQGGLAWNRAIWTGIGFAVLALTYARFRFGLVETRSPRRWWRRSRAALAAEPVPRTAPVVMPRAQRDFGPATRLRQLREIARQSFRAIVMSRGALVLLVPSGFLAVLAPELMVHMGTPLLPTTGTIVALLGSTGDIVLWIAAPFLIVLYAGELVWREREAGLSDIADAAPVPDWVQLLGKFMGLCAILVLLQAVMLAAGLFMQASLDYYDFEIGLYLRMLFGLQLVDYLLFAVLALTVHVVANHKYVAHFVVVLAYAFTSFAAPLGIEHNLLVYGADPGWSYSDLRGFGPFVAPVLWFKLYWAGWALLLAACARLFWVRGRDRDFPARVALARRRFRGSAAAAAVAAMAVVAAAGGFIFYNTNVLNAYRPASASKARAADYERRYGQYRGQPQPQLTSTNLRVEIYPERRIVEVRGSYTLANRTPSPIAAIHVVTRSAVEVGRIEFDKAATCTPPDDGHGHRICTLAAPLLPGETVRLGFDVRVEPRGFPNSGMDGSISAHATAFRQQQVLPAIGYQEGRELIDGDRVAHGLPPRPGVTPLEEAGDSVDAGAWRMAFEAVVGTSEGQIAVAPGTLRREWTENGRRYFHYATDTPIRNDVAFYSAAYAVREARAGDVAIQILHHPAHTLNLDRMVRSVQASLAYYTKQFGPYPHGQIRLVEHAGDGNGLHSAPINISFEEGFSLLNPGADPRGLDFPFAIVAHEVAHQWWGNQVTPAYAEGGALVSEAVSWYAAMGVVEEAGGAGALARLLGMMREAYLAPQSRAAVALLRADSWFLAYRKGPFAMYAVREYIGADKVDTALRRIFRQHAGGAPPLPTSLDLYRELQAVTPAPLHSLLADLFETNTYWQLTTTQVTAVPDGKGAWQVTLDVRARKVVVDLAGAETEVPMADLIEIGVYSDETLYRQMHRIRAGTQRITVTVPSRPARAGIDPRNLLIDVKPGDNVMAIPH